MKNTFLKLVTFLTLIVTFISCDSSDDDSSEIDSCAELEFESRVFSDGGVFGEFVAGGIVSESEIAWAWKIDDDFVLNEDNNVLIYEFTENGSYEVTVFVETQECSGTSFTETIIIDEVADAEETDSCPELEFESRVYSDGGVFGEFVAEEIEAESTGKYEWKINDEIVSNETVFRDNEDNHVLVYEFTEDGNYEVTVSIETPECPIARSVNQTIVVEEFEKIEEIDPCAELEFSSNVFSTGGSVFGQFSTDSIVSDSARRYEWKIDGEIVSNVREFTDNEDDHILEYEFTENASYEVTVSIETPECPVARSTSQTVVVDIVL